MKPYQKAIIVLTLILLGLEYIPRAYKWIQGDPPVRAGQVWVTKVRVMHFLSQIVHEERIDTYVKRVVRVDEDNNVIFIENDKDTVSEPIKTFLFDSVLQN